MRRVGTLLGLAGVAAFLGAAAYMAARSGGTPSATVRNPAPPTERVRVEVLNASGVPGQAREATLRLRDSGFDVVHFGNARSFDRDSSAVVDRVGRPDLARAVADALGVGEVVSEPNANLFVDVTVLLGSEWEGGVGAVDVEAAPPEREPWDPRGWIGR